MLSSNSYSDSAARVLQRVFAVSAFVRYVAIYRNGILESSQRDNAVAASASESDRYEELLVNPTLLMLVMQRGAIDCGGTRYVVVRYGNFYQLVAPIEGGHVSVCFDLDADVLELAEATIAAAYVP